MRKKDGAAENDEFGIFSIPMILAVDEVAGKIKNATYKKYLYHQKTP